MFVLRMRKDPIVHADLRFHYGTRFDSRKMVKTKSLLDCYTLPYFSRPVTNKFYEASLFFPRIRLVFFGRLIDQRTAPDDTYQRDVAFEYEFRLLCVLAT